MHLRHPRFEPPTGPYLKDERTLERERMIAEWATEVGVSTPFDNRKNEVAHINGVPWHEAPVPPKRHDCWPQTRGWYNYFEAIERCACGGMHHPSRWPGKWFDRNTRKDEVASR